MDEGTASTPKLGRRRIIERPRLIRMLDESPERIKLLVAPAGYGKTTLARQWLARRVAAWYAVTNASRDVAALATGIRRACSSVCGSAGDALIQRLRVTSDAAAETETLAVILSEDLAPWPNEAWLVVDDYEAIAGSKPAEAFIASLVAQSHINLIILARSRPTWATSRRILYGDVFEMSRDRLALTVEEAAALLPRHQVSAADLVTMSGGWPAVIALAARADATPPDLIGEPHLFEFFADEIFSRLDAPLRKSLATLGLFGRDGIDLALNRLSQRDRIDLIDRGSAAGLLHVGADGVEIHPLLRSFLHRKAFEHHPHEIRAAVTSTARALIDAGSWDEAFALIERHRLIDLLPELVHTAMGDLLASGRVHTLEQWVAAAPTSDAAIQLARAEVALRSGRYYEAETLARLAATDRDEDEAATALLAAGRAAHVASREEAAARYYEEALTHATTEALRLRAELGLIQAALELEDDSVHARLAALDEASAVDPTLEVMVADRKIGIETRFCLPVDVTRGRAARQLLPLVEDPMVRTSFRNVFGYALAAVFEVDEAEALTKEQLVDAERCRLDFVIPYAQIVLALAMSCRRDYDGASAALDEVWSRSGTIGDHAVTNVALPVRARVYIAQAAFASALALPASLTSPATTSLAGEYAACRALALAGVGQHTAAAHMADQARSKSASAESQICSHAALAVCALRSGAPDSGEALAVAALECATRSGMIESLIAAVRGFPDLALCLIPKATGDAEVERVLRLAGVVTDQPATHLTHGSVFSLTRREREVLALLATSMSNRQIAEKLFISPVTVKVHARNIYEKLGVRSRAEAVLRAGQLGS